MIKTVSETWTVQDVLRPGRLHRLVGDTDAVSMAALDVALSVASGTHWFGQPVAQGRTLYVSAFGPAPAPQTNPAFGLEARTLGAGPRKPEPSALSLRLTAWKAHHGVNAIPSFGATGALQVAGELWYSQANHIRGGNYAAVVFDDPSWVRIAGSKDNGTDPGAVIQELSSLAAKSGAALIVTQNSWVEAAGGSVLKTTDAGSSVVLAVQDRVGAAPFRLSRTAVPVVVGSDRYTPEILTV